MTIEKSLPNMVMVCVDGAITSEGITSEGLSEKVNSARKLKFHTED